MRQPTNQYQAPRCEHGHILLGCPEDTCTEQNNYLAKQQQQLDQYHKTQQDNIQKLIEHYLKPTNPNSHQPSKNSSAEE